MNEKLAHLALGPGSDLASGRPGTQPGV